MFRSGPLPSVSGCHRRQTEGWQNVAIDSRFPLFLLFAGKFRNPFSVRLPLQCSLSSQPGYQWLLPNPRSTCAQTALMVVVNPTGTDTSQIHLGTRSGPHCSRSLFVWSWVPMLVQGRPIPLSCSQKKQSSCIQPEIGHPLSLERR